MIIFRILFLLFFNKELVWFYWIFIYLKLIFLDFIINKKIFDHFDSFDKLEEYKCPIRHSTFVIYPVNLSLIFRILINNSFLRI